MKAIISFLLCAWIPCLLHAQDPTGKDDNPTGIRKLETVMERISRKKYDTSYVSLPRHPWRVILRNKLSQTDIHFKSKISAEEAFGEGSTGHIRWESRMRTPVTYSAGIWVGYRGLGMGFQKEAGSSKGSHLSLSAASSRFSFQLRYRESELNRMDINVSGIIDGTPLDNRKQLDLMSPVKAKAFIADGYYLFNGRKCSYNAAYKQAVIQKRSAGSVIIGALAYYADIDYAHHGNADFIRMMDNIGQLKICQGSLGGGYTYNYVPAAGWTVNVLLMPMVTLLNSSTQYHYDVSENGLQAAGHHTSHHNIDYNIDGRMGITRNWDRLFISLSGQLNHFYYRQQHTRGQTIDWLVNLSLGTRL